MWGEKLSVARGNARLRREETLSTTAPYTLEVTTSDRPHGLAIAFRCACGFNIETQGCGCEEGFGAKTEAPSSFTQSARLSDKGGRGFVPAGCWSSQVSLVSLVQFQKGAGLRGISGLGSGRVNDPLVAFRWTLQRLQGC